MIRIGERVEASIPCIEILNGERKYYLAPFRGYKFQVSGTLDGGGDYGSTEVVGLLNIYNALIDVGGCNAPCRQSNVSGKHMVAEIYYCMAMTAILLHSQHGLVAERNEDNGLTNEIKIGYEDRRRLYKFIEECVEWVAGHI
jgi:hypothetical protein